MHSKAAVDLGEQRVVTVATPVQEVVGVDGPDEHAGQVQVASDGGLLPDGPDIVESDPLGFVDGVRGLDLVVPVRDHGRILVELLAKADFVVALKAFFLSVAPLQKQRCFKMGLVLAGILERLIDVVKL